MNAKVTVTVYQGMDDDSIGDTTGMTDEQIENAKYEICELEIERLTAEFPNVKFTFDDGHYVPFGSRVDCDDDDLRELIEDALDRSFEEWCSRPA
jgi:hypothetical protein